MLSKKLLLLVRLYKSILLSSSHDDSFYPHSHGYFCRDTDLLTVINMMSCFGPEMGLPKKKRGTTTLEVLQGSISHNNKS